MTNEIPYESDGEVGSYIKNFSYQSARYGFWTPHRRTGFKLRDLGMRNATNGAMSAELMKFDSAGDARWEARLRKFDWMYVVSGSVDCFVNGADDEITLNAKDVIRFAPNTPVKFSNASSDFVAAEVYETAGEDKFVTAADASRLAVCQPSVERYSDDCRVKGGGIRPYFSYRNFNAKPFHIQEITMDEVIPLGTGFHIHTCGQFAYVFSGEARLIVERQEPIILRPGDAVYLSPGTAHNFLDYTLDYSVFEMTMPAEYDTIDVVVEPWPDASKSA